MKTFFFFIRRALPLLMLFFIFSCNNNPKNTAVKNWVTRYSAGNHFQPEAPVTVTFTKDLPLFKNLSEEEKDHVITFQPQVKGHLFRMAGKTLLFQPEKPLDYNRTYKVTVHLDKLFPHPGISTFRFTLKTAPLEVNMKINGMVPYMAGRKSFVRLNGTLTASGNLDRNKIKKALSAREGDKRLPVKLVSPAGSDEVQFTVDSIERTDNAQQIEIHFDGNLLGASGIITKKYTVPSLKKFTFLQYNLVDKPQIYLQLVFSDRLDPQQNLKGLIYFADGIPVNLNRKNNTVQVYLKNKPDGSHKLILKKNIRSIHGATLPSDVTLEPYFKMAPPQVRFVGKGNILPGKEKWIIPFQAINLRAVDVVVFKIYANNVKQFLQDNRLSNGDSWTLHKVGEYILHKKISLTGPNEKADNQWKTYAIDLSKMVNADPGAIYRVSLRFRKPYATLECTLADTVQDFADSTDYYASGYYYPPKYQWTKRNDPCDRSYYTSGKFKARNFLATNIGLTVKNSAGGKYFVFARDILSDKALDKVKLTFYSYQNQPLASVTTNTRGEAVATVDKKPYLLVARWEKQFAYLKLSGGNALSYSKFNVSGTEAKNGLKGMIFGERGVWRPGDTLHLTFVLQDLKKSLPAGYPVRFAVWNARNKKIFTETSTRGTNGFYVFKVPTRPDAPTGLWHAEVRIGNQRFTKNLRIETVLPNRLKIHMTTSAGRFFPGGSKWLSLQSVWLNGGVASGLKAQVTETIRARKTTFKGYRSYVFDDPSKSFYSDEREVFNGKLDSHGNARFQVVLPDKNGLPGMLNLTFVAKVFEAGGRFSIDQKSFAYVPFKTFVGLEVPQASSGSGGYLETGQKQPFEVVTLNSNGQKVSVKNLKVEIFKLEWSWWYNSNNSRLATYISRNFQSRVFVKTINTIQGKGRFYYQVDYPQWGRYFIRVTDPVSGHSTGAIVYYDWPSSYGRQNRMQGGATLLGLSTGQPKYHPGDEATISFPAPAGAKALISIEKNDKVLKTWWVDTQEKETQVRFKITPQMAPNVYVSVSVIQPHLQTVNDLPIRSYGVVPVMVDDPQTFLKPIISAPGKIKPDSKYQIKVREAGGRSMTYVLAVVDDGLLDLTHFKTPSLHGYFYRKEALAVNTWDFYNDVIGAYGLRLSQVFAIGGGNAVKELSRKKLNRFRPVVTFLGPFVLPKGSKGRVHYLKMPNYVGSVRVMVMAGNGKGAYGSAQKTVTVKQPLMVLASLPRQLVPGETLRLPVTVFAMENNVKNVRLNVSANKLFKVIQKPGEVVFRHPGQKMAYITLKVSSAEGVGKVKITAVSGKEKASYDVSLRVRNPNRRVYHTENFALSPGKSVRTKPQFIPGTADPRFVFSVSRIPAIRLEKRVQYLIQYPFGCVEQVVSSALAQLYLGRLTQLSDQEEKTIEKNINNVISRLSGWQAYSGGFSYWPGGSAVSDWGTSYAGQFLLLAKEEGYYVPADLFDAWVVYQQKAANAWDEKPDRSGRYTHDLNQAYRLYTLALAGKPVMSAMNRMRGMTGLSPAATLRLAAAYALLNEKTTAQRLIRNVRWNSSGEPAYWRNNFGSSVRDEALALETYLLTGDKATAFRIFKSVTKALGSDRWMSTQTTAFALYSVALFAGKNTHGTPFTFVYKYGKTKTAAKSGKPVFVKKMTPLSGKPLVVDNTSGQTLFLDVETSGIPLPGKMVNQQQNLNMKVSWFDMNGQVISPDHLSQGKDFYAKVEVYNPTLRNYDHLALSFVVPSGWEILNTRLLDLGNGLHSSPSDYIDIRDDRVNVFFRLDYKRKKQFYILLNAAYPGHYFMIPAGCRDMYDHTVQAVVGGGTVDVVKE